MPHKKPRKKLLSDEQKEENQIISSYRIKVEHAIC
ncbi:MAG: IS5 family transposase, partial [Oscillospiraceae bacterium]|nr:IS5 family transposase [Oscillospiraceae bacterium]